MAGEVIVITSGKGGVGKTTATANLGTAMAANGSSAVVLDADIGLRNLDVVMGLENRIVYDIVDVVNDNCRLQQALIRDKRFDHLALLPAAQTKDKSAVQPEQMEELCDELCEKFDYVFVDSPAGIEQGFKNAIQGAHRALIVTTPEVSAVRDADRIIGLLHAQGIEDPMIIINRIKPDMVNKRDMMDVEDIEDILSVKIIGIVPDDERIIVSTNRGQPAVLDNKSLAGQAFKNICLRISGEDVPFMSFDNGLISRLKKLVGLS